jgi:hypothetical protein
MLIDCDACTVRGPVCGQCVVTVLLGAPPRVGATALELDNADCSALAVLAGSGLVPPLRLVTPTALDAEPDGRSGPVPGARAVG